MSLDLLPDVSVIDPATVAAYAQTEYRVAGAPGFVLRVGQASAELLAAHRAHGVDCSAFLTACNPFSSQLGDEANAARQRSLAADLRARSLAFVPGVGQHPANGWPAEESFLVFGLSLEAAKALGRRHAQNAIVWSDARATPQLVLLR